MKTNKRNALAVSTLQAGGRFVRKLEPNFRGHLKMTTRLQNSAGQVIPGVGYATFRELVDAGLIDLKPLGAAAAYCATFEVWILASLVGALEGGAAVAFDQAISQF